MKTLLKALSIVILFAFLTLIPGCGCNDTNPQKQDEKPVNALDPNFKGPDSLPFSKGPTESPPSI
jgi:hypothetical protein